MLKTDKADLYTENEIIKSNAKLVAISRGSYIETKKYFKHYCYFRILMPKKEDQLLGKRYALKQIYYEIPWVNLFFAISLIIISIIVIT